MKVTLHLDPEQISPDRQPSPLCSWTKPKKKEETIKTPDTEVFCKAQIWGVTRHYCHARLHQRLILLKAGLGKYFYRLRDFLEKYLLNDRHFHS